MAIIASRKQIGLLLTVLGISCLLLAPAAYFLEMTGTVFTDDDEMGIDNIPIGLFVCLFVSAVH